MAFMAKCTRVHFQFFRICFEGSDKAYYKLGSRYQVELFLMFQHIGS